MTAFLARQDLCITMSAERGNDKLGDFVNERQAFTPVVQHSSPRLKYLLSEVFSGGTPDTNNEEYWTDDVSGIAWVAIGDMSGRERVEVTQKKITIEGAQSKRLTILPVGTLIYSMYASVGHVAELAIQSTINQALLGFKFIDGVSKNYIKWYLRHLQIEILEEVNSNTQDNLNAEKVLNFRIHLPLYAEQEKIASILENAIAKIDALLFQKRQLIYLLAEKRRALITQAVTKGLDSSVQMKDSGISWLGEIPAHWQLTRLRFLLDNIEQGWSPQSDNFPASLDEWGVVKAGCVNGWTLNENENKRLPSDLIPIQEYEIKSGDILMSRANTTELLGSAVLVENVRPKLLLCDKIYRLKIKPESPINKQFLVFVLRSAFGRYQLEREATGASNSMQNIGQEIVTNCWIPFPPPDEQQHIVNHVKEVYARIDALWQATERTIKLLQERRSALISDAVTGKISFDSMGSTTEASHEN